MAPRHHDAVWRGRWALPLTHLAAVAVAAAAAVGRRRRGDSRRRGPWQRMLAWRRAARPPCLLARRCVPRRQRRACRRWGRLPSVWQPLQLLLGLPPALAPAPAPGRQQPRHQQLRHQLPPLMQRRQAAVAARKGSRLERRREAAVGAVAPAVVVAAAAVRQVGVAVWGGWQHRHWQPCLRPLAAAAGWRRATVVKAAIAARWMTRGQRPARAPAARCLV